MSDEAQTPEQPENVIAPVLVCSETLVFGVCEAGLFWWNVFDGRVVLMRGSDVMKAAMLELYEGGGVCDTHGLEGSYIGVVDSFKTAFKWLAGEPIGTVKMH